MRKPLWTYLACCVAVFMISMDNLIVTNALPVRFGRRRLMVIGIAVFTAASAASALAPSIGVLIAARAAQGVGAAVTDAASWHWIFWINVPVGVAVLPLLLARESRSGTGRLDPAGVVLATAGLSGIVFGLVRGGSHGWTSGPVLGALAGGVVLLAAFGARESRAATPMLPLSLSRSRGFSAASATMMLTTMGMFGVIFLVSQFLQSVLGYTPLAAGGGSSPSASRCRPSASGGSLP